MTIGTTGLSSDLESLSSWLQWFFHGLVTASPVTEVGLVHLGDEVQQG
jgi:hypothetical protein